MLNLYFVIFAMDLSDCHSYRCIPIYTVDRETAVEAFYRMYGERWCTISNPNTYSRHIGHPIEILPSVVIKSTEK